MHVSSIPLIFLFKAYLLSQCFPFLQVSLTPKSPLSQWLIFPAFCQIPLPSIPFFVTSQLGSCAAPDLINTCPHVKYLHS